MSSADYTPFLEKKLDDEALRLTVLMLSTLIKEYGGLDEVVDELNRIRENLNHNTDRIIEELNKDAK